MEKYLEDFVIVKESEIHGYGIFAGKDISEGSAIMEIRGEVISEEECVRREDEEGNVYIFWNDTNYIDVAKTDKIKYINHECDCNCGVEENDEESLLLVAVKDIKEGDELCIDYGYDEIYDYCSCKSCSQDE